MVYKIISNKLLKINYILIPVLVNFLIFESIIAKNSADDVLIQNVKWIIKSEIIIINYDLIGPIRDKYEIKIAMKKENDPAFLFIPRAVEGDIGIGNFAGLKREIIWYYRRDIPQGITSDEKYYFEITVKETSGSKTWIYYLVGGALALGAGIILLTSKAKDQTQKELPTPPGRP